MGVKIRSIITKGSKGTLVDIECHLSNNLPNIVIVGSASKAVDEARERIRGAFASSRIMLPRKRITLNLAPADLPKADSGFDMAMAVAILLANGEVTRTIQSEQAFIGELGLDGSTRAVRGIIGKLLIGRAKGLTTFFIPYDNLKQAQLVPHITLVPVRNLRQLYEYFTLFMPIKEFSTGSGHYDSVAATTSAPLALSEIVGQHQGKSALEVAAAGGHNIFFHGAPGSGKSMLAKALASILPPLSLEEMLEVTQLHSLADSEYEQLVTARPFRSPHHSASHVAIVGGGNRLRPGEISLAHRGVLFLDELPEFDRDTLEALRQPLEDKIINVARVKETAEYPANFILVATANPCPCGYKGYDACKCTNAQVTTYQKRISGPILDRIDIYCHVASVEHSKLLNHASSPQDDETIRQRIILARQRQRARFGNSSKLNADMTGSDIKRLARLTPYARATLNDGAVNMKLSARAYMRTIKVARTIADLHDSNNILRGHMAIALRLRKDTLWSRLPT